MGARAMTHPEIAVGDAGTIDRMIEQFKAELRNKGDALLPEDRPTLLRFYDRLLLRQIRREQKTFYATAHDDLIANRALTLIDEELNAEGDAA